MVVSTIDDFVVVSDDVSEDDVSCGFEETSVVDVMSISGEDSEDSVVDVTSIASEVSFFVVAGDSKVVVDELAASEDPSVLAVENSSVKEDCVTTSEAVLALELPPALALVTSMGKVDVDSDSVLSDVDSETFVVDDVVGRVTSGGHGLSFVVLLIVGRVGKIDEELSELDEISVEVTVEVSDVKSTVLDGVKDETSPLEVEVEVLLESCVVSVEKLEVSVGNSVDLLRSRTSMVVVE